MSQNKVHYWAIVMITLTMLLGLLAFLAGIVLLPVGLGQFVWPPHRDAMLALALLLVAKGMVLSLVGVVLGQYLTGVIHGKEKNQST